MKLILTIESPTGLPATTPQSRTVESGQITIGRGADNDWVLPDPDRHLSKNHCAVALSASGATVTDTSTNGVFVNDAGAPLGRGGQVSLRDGDNIALGEYRIGVKLSEVQAGERTALFDNDPFAAVLAEDWRPDAPTPARKEPLAPDLPDLDNFAPPPMQRAPEPPPFDDDLLSDPGQPDPLADIGRGSGSDFPFLDDPGSSPGGGSSDDILGGPPLGGPAGGPLPDDGWSSAPSDSDHVPSEQGFFRPPNVEPPAIPDDWDIDELLGPDPIEPSAAQPQPVPQPVPQPAPPPQQPAAAPPPAPAAAPAPPAGPASGAGVDGGAALLAAFFRGAGIEPPQLSGEEASKLMEEVGQSYREMVAGLREILMARSSIKNELRVERTVIRAAENNPLKFSVNEEEALVSFLVKRHPGFLPPLDATRQGFADVKAHEMAVMAGVQAAILAMLKQFDPKALTEKLEKTSFLSGMLPGSRKSRYWEAYEKHYRQIATEAMDDFQGLFGREFAKAYEQQTRKL
ncbi:type VI secretion system-associated FHA domain protein TagH [Inquilinus sp. CAU 1745]|uniref:type VI secretion system-associated FHA domain protein TagH n=1 Tax=Inquilinus sp. CAU 1745 TaxID=3140369 RepID=UPI00325B37CF